MYHDRSTYHSEVGEHALYETLQFKKVIVSLTSTAHNYEKNCVHSYRFCYNVLYLLMQELLQLDFGIFFCIKTYRNASSECTGI